MKTENLSKQELQEINTVLNKYRNKRISLKELLEYFQVEYFLDYGYTTCSDFFITRVTLEESSIHSLLSRYQELLKYKRLHIWRRLYNYVDFWYNVDRCGTIFPVNLIRHKVSEIDWSLYELHLRPIRISSRILKECKCININYLIATDRVLNVLTNIAYIKENSLEKYKNEFIGKF